MDQSALDPQLADGLKNLSARDKSVSARANRPRQELNQFIQAEGQKAQIQATIHALTDTCFRKCITSKISAGKLDRYEEPCTQNCVDRYMDANLVVIKHLEQMRNA
ncbi:Mitochondrial import inner membrane translocase subunit tim8 [Teratosphaeriaceae sp. CCFEE 6253]|nr:Mitochondrial import inner membrane translocase subunit tim8 [Teratosphaeriaceae sp. CCFEE 6253]